MITWSSFATFISVSLLVLDGYALYRAISRGGGVESTLAWIFAILALPGVGALAFLGLSSPNVGRVLRRKRNAKAYVRGSIDAKDLRQHAGRSADETPATAASEAPQVEGAPADEPHEDHLDESAAEADDRFPRPADATEAANAPSIETSGGPGTLAAALEPEEFGISRFRCRPEQIGEVAALKLAAELTGLVPTGGNQVTLLSEDALAFRRIEDLLREAQHYIWAEYYIIRNDETGRRFLDLLVAKAADGVQVRLLFDAVGSLGLDGQRLDAIRRLGGEVADFLPMNPLRRRWSVHLRNHRKMVVVDGQYGFTGGMNVGDEYSGRARRKGRQHFRDTHLMIEGPAVYDLAQTFVEDWNFATGQLLAIPVDGRPSRAGQAVVGIVPSGPDQDFNANGLVYFSGIAQAQRTVFLTTPYFVPDQPTLRALESAALRGVDVRLLVPRHNDVWLVSLALRSYFAELLQAGVRIFEYEKSMLHAKTVSVDGEWGIVGSANVDFRSFRLNFELSALVVDPEFGGMLDEKFFSDLRDSTEITMDDVRKHPMLSRFRDNLARLLSPLL